MASDSKAKGPASNKRWGRRWALRWALLLLSGALLILVASTSWLAAFGGRITGQRLARVQHSKNWANGTFQNPIPTQSLVPGTGLKTVRMSLFGPEGREPSHPVPMEHRTAADYAQPAPSGLRATWMGHASVFIELDGRRILLDPMFSERGSPSTLVGPKRFFEPPIALEDLPPLDAVVISHDHFDHLDMASVKRLNLRGVTFAVPLGVGANLEAWGVPPGRIIELDWNEETTLSGLRLRAMPARHYSGRALVDNNHTLWASWLIIGPQHRVYFSGDTGYLPGLKDVGADYGPFDLTIQKTGAYGETWPDIHMDPEQAVQAHLDVRGRVMIPVHWGTLNLAFHAFGEPADRVVAAAKAHGVTLVVPRPGQLVDVLAPPPLETWW